MNNGILKYGNILAWVVMVVTAMVVLWHEMSLHARMEGLDARIPEIEDGIERLRRERRIAERVGQRCIGLNNATWSSDKNVMFMLQQCESREQFVVREGPRTVWSELCGSTARSKKIGIYVPVGGHRLRYAVGFGEKWGGVGYQHFRDGDPRDIDGAVTVELGPDAEVYEFRLNVSDEQPPRIEVIGRDNVLVHEAALPLRARGTIFRTSINEGFAFPSEFKPNEKERPYFLKPELPPITDLGFLRGGATVRLWIESDARPCMPAFYVVANYFKVTSLRYRHDNPPLIQEVTDPDTEFKRLFEPYDGSLRFYFREGIFQGMSPAASKELLQLAAPLMRSGGSGP